MKLNPKQLRFCQEYVADLNATQAAIRAGFKERSAKVTACRLLTKANIQSKIQELQKKISDRLEITPDMIIQELASIGFAKITDYVKVIQPKSLDDIMNDVDAGRINVPYPGEEDDENEEKEQVNFSAVEVFDTEKMKNINAIASIKQGRNGIEVKLHDKVRALENIGRHLGMWNDKIDHTTKGKEMIPINPITQIEVVHINKDEK
jgi:phage terminase small subunit